MSGRRRRSDTAAPTGGSSRAISATSSTDEKAWPFASIGEQPDGNGGNWPFGGSRANLGGSQAKLSPALSRSLSERFGPPAPRSSVLHSLQESGQDALMGFRMDDLVSTVKKQQEHIDELAGTVSSQQKHIENLVQ
jgi:hypothetical protein